MTNKSQPQPTSFAHRCAQVPKKHWFVAAAVILILVLLAVFGSHVFPLKPNNSNGSELSGGQYDLFFYVPFSVAEGKLDGTLLNFSNQTTSSVDLSKFKEYSLWLNCSGWSKNLNVTNISTVRYQISLDGNLWVNGSNTLCAQNFTKVDITDKSFRYIRLDLKGNQEFGINATQNNIRMYVSAK